jgi:chemotaxis methyl-accepting protein methylase
MADYIYSLCAITLDQTKGYLIESRLSHLVDALGCRSFRDLMARAKAETDGAIKRRIIDGITTNETLFFRDSAPFDLLRFKLIPQMLDRRKGSGGTAPIRIWSAACSTGQEIYSVAMVLKEVLGDPYRYGVRLLGTDISDEAVAKASKGIFTQVEISRGLPDAARLKYFRPVEGGWQISDELRALVSFKKKNLMADFGELGRFDVVFCRNVAIYFNERDKIALFRASGAGVGAQRSPARRRHGIVERHLPSIRIQTARARGLLSGEESGSPFLNESLVRSSTVLARSFPVLVPRSEARSAIRPATARRAARPWPRSPLSRRLDWWPPASSGCPCRPAAACPPIV